MDAAWTIAAIALSGAGFMLWFLIGLLRESPPAVCYWIVPVLQKPKIGKSLEGLKRIYMGEDCHVMAAKHDECHGQFLESENHEMEKCKSGLIAVDVRAISGRLGWRAIHPKHVYSFREIRHR